MISIILPSYDHLDLLDQVLRALGSQCREAIVQKMVEIIVVDSSTLIDSKSLESKHPEVQFQFFPNKISAAKARNQGVRKSFGDTLVFLDSDCVPSEKWWANLVALAQTDLSQARIYTGPVFYDASASSFARAWHLVEFHEFLSRSKMRLRFPASGNFMIKKSLFLRLGSFDEGRPLYEDFSLKTKIDELDIEVFYHPDLAVTHLQKLELKADFFNKALTMGWWRGSFDREDLSLLKALPGIGIGFLFFALISWRLLKFSLRSLISFWRLLPKTLPLCLQWGIGYCRGRLAQEL